jgi:hypothetical protein
MYGLNPFMPIKYIVPIKDCYLVNMWMTVWAYEQE